MQLHYCFLEVNSNDADQIVPKKASEYEQKIPKSHTTDQLLAPRGRSTECLLSQDIRKTVKAKQPALSSPSR